MKHDLFDTNANASGSEQRELPGIWEDTDATRADHLLLAMTTTAHDLRQHLHSLSITLDTVAKVNRSPDVEPWLDGARRQARRLKRHLEHLALSSHSCGALPETRAFRINEVLNEIRLNWADEAMRRRVHLSVLYCDAKVQSNRRLLTVVLDNLLSNAVKHTARSCVRVSSKILGKELVVSIDDTGSGIRNAASQPPETHGLGLGWTIIRRTAALLRHKITVTTSAPSGTSVRLHVPLAVDIEGDTQLALGVDPVELG